MCLGRSACMYFRHSSHLMVRGAVRTTQCLAEWPAFATVASIWEPFAAGLLCDQGAHFRFTSCHTHPSCVLQASVPSWTRALPHMPFPEMGVLTSRRWELVAQFCTIACAFAVDKHQVDMALRCAYLI